MAQIMQPGRMLLRYSKIGNIGINTNTATHKLEVLGTGIVNGGTAAFKGSQWYSI